MKLAIACDHAGLALKREMIQLLRKERHKLIDLGTNTDRPVDYPDYATAIAKAIQAGRAERGILICGSGVGASVAANKFLGIRAGLCHDTYSAHQGVEHDNVNVLCLGSRVVGPQLAWELIRAFLAASFSKEPRHIRRLAKIDAIERER
jgi:RpiB/LacA/LacB family sugar-phosphate isomerase